MEASTIFAVAHRGASNEYPENTVAAFDRAIELGAPAVEFDVRMAADGVPVIFHDAEISRTTSGQGLLQDWTSHDLMRLDAGTWKHPRFAGVRIPTLGEALACIADRARPVVELKVPIAPDLLMRHLYDFGVTQRCLVISFVADQLAQLHGSYPLVPLGLLADEWDDELPTRAAQIGADVLVLNSELLTLGRVERAGTLGLDVWSYTVNHIGTVALCGALGVKGIITDQPDLIRPVRR